MASTILTFLDHTQRRITVGRTPLDKWSARRRDLYLTTHNTHNRRISTSPVGFEPTISAGERPQNYTLDRAATGTGINPAVSTWNFASVYIYSAANCAHFTHAFFLLFPFFVSSDISLSYITVYCGRQKYINRLFLKLIANQISYWKSSYFLCTESSTCPAQKIFKFIAFALNSTPKL